jgi:hypothetical protein
VFDLRSGKALLEFHAPAEIMDIAQVPGTRQLAVLSQRGHCQFWNLDSGQLLAEHDVGPETPRSLHVSRDGKRMAILTDQATVYDLESWTKVGSIAASVPINFALLGTGSAIAIQDNRGLRVIRVADGAQLLDLRDYCQLEAMALSPSGNTLVLQKDAYLDFIEGQPEVSATGASSANLADH